MKWNVAGIFFFYVLEGQRFTRQTWRAYGRTTKFREYCQANAKVRSKDRTCIRMLGTQTFVTCGSVVFCGVFINFICSSWVPSSKIQSYRRLLSYLFLSNCPVTWTLTWAILRFVSNSRLKYTMQDFPFRSLLQRDQCGFSDT